VRRRRRRRTLLRPAHAGDLARVAAAGGRRGLARVAAARRRVAPVIAGSTRHDSARDDNGPTNKELAMGLFDGVLGNASKIDPAKIQQEFAQILAPGESVEHAYQLIRDYFVFTDKRFVLVDKQGITGSKVEYHSIPYKSITHFSIETAGTFDLDAELKIWISGTAMPIQKQFNKRLSIYEVQSVLASYVLR
jgi:hypothetical protein